MGCTHADPFRTRSRAAQRWRKHAASLKPTGGASITCK